MSGTRHEFGCQKLDPVLKKEIMLNYSKLNDSLHFIYLARIKHFGCDENTTFFILKSLKNSISAFFVTKLWH